jgi:hypothetical protein
LGLWAVVAAVVVVDVDAGYKQAEEVPFKAPVGCTATRVCHDDTLTVVDFRPSGLQDGLFLAPIWPYAVSVVKRWNVLRRTRRRHEKIK